MGAERVKGEGSSSDGAKKLIRCIIGPGRHEVQTFACAVKITMYQLFHEKTAQDDIVVTRDIYSRVAEQLGKGERTVSRQIQRMGNLCWEHFGTGGQKTYIGREMKVSMLPAICCFIWLTILISESRIMKCWKNSRDCSLEKSKKRYRKV